MSIPFVEYEKLRITFEKIKGEMFLVLKTQHVPTIVNMDRFATDCKKEGIDCEFFPTNDGYGFLRFKLAK
jgi:hypothetical protein